MKILSIGLTALRRLFRDRTNIFFVLVFPLLLILIIGSVFGGEYTPRIGIVADGSGAFGDELVAALNDLDELETELYADTTELQTAVERARADAGIVIPPGYDVGLRAGEAMMISYLAAPNSPGLDVQSLVTAVVADQAARVRAARFVAAEGLGDFDAGLGLADDATAIVPAVTVSFAMAGGVAAPQVVGQFDTGAAQELLLFMFLTAMAASAALIQSRRLGVSRRMLATPTSAATIITGEAFGRFLVVLFQGLFIVIAASLLFAVNWGNWPAALAIVVAFALVGTGAGLLIGSLFRSEQQAGGVAIGLALAMAAFGGSMVPLEFFSDSMRQAAHVTPHAWANEAFETLILHNGGIGDITTELGALLAMAVGLIAIAVVLFRRALTR
jgi:ABC-2 type transport system permease protein